MDIKNIKIEQETEELSPISLNYDIVKEEYIIQELESTTDDGKYDENLDTKEVKNIKKTMKARRINERFNKSRKKAFYTNSILAHDMVNHPKSCVLTCHICLKTFKTKTYLTMHIRSHTDQECVCPDPDCGNRFSSRDARTRHIANVHLGKNLYRRSSSQSCDKEKTSTVGQKESEPVRKGSPEK